MLSLHIETTQQLSSAQNDHFRIVVAVLDNFHFDLSKSTEMEVLAPLPGLSFYGNAFCEPGRNAMLHVCAVLDLLFFASSLVMATTEETDESKAETQKTVEEKGEGGEEETMPEEEEVREHVLSAVKLRSSSHL